MPDPRSTSFVVVVDVNEVLAVREAAAAPVASVDVAGDLGRHGSLDRARTVPDIEDLGVAGHALEVGLLDGDAPVARFPGNTSAIAAGGDDDAMPRPTRRRSAGDDHSPANLGDGGVEGE